MFSFKSSRANVELSEKAKTEIVDLEMEVTIKLKRKGSYGDQGEVSEIKVEKNLLVTSDSPIKEIEKETGAVIEGVFDDFMGKVKVSRHLSDGFIADKNKADAI